MQIRSVLFIVGVLLVCVGASLVLPLGVSLWYGDGAFLGLLSSLVIMVGGGLALAYTNRSQTPLNLTWVRRGGHLLDRGELRGRAAVRADVDGLGDGCGF